MSVEDLPDDADGDAIRRVIEDGADLTKPMEIDFAVAFPTRDAGTRFQRALGDKGFRTSLEHDEGGTTWTCYCAKTMMLTYGSVTGVQGELDEIAKAFGGQIDGWGTFGNAQS